MEATHQPSYYEQRMAILGVTPETNTVNLWFGIIGAPGNELKAVPIFREVERGIDILVYTLKRHQIPYAKEGSRYRKEVYCITRLEEPRIKKDGSSQKYDMPKGQPVMPFFPPALVDKYDAGEAIPVLYITEGYFKAFKAQMHGLDCVGLPSITCMKDRETGQLHEDIKRLVDACKVQRLVWLTDGDCRNLSSKEIEDGADLYRRPRQFFQTVAMFYDLTSGLDNVTKYFAHINSDDLEGQPKGLDDLLVELPDSTDAIVKEAQAFDRVKGGVSAGTFFTKINITFGVGTVHKYFLLHDVDVFYLHHLERRPELRGKEFKFNGTLYKYDEQDAKCTIIVPRDASRYFRVGDRYFEHLDVPNKYGALTKTFHGRDKSTISDDNGKTIFQHIAKYKAFCIVPDHSNYQRVIHNCFNLYHPFEHEMEEGDCPQTLDFLRHIFGTEKVTIPGTEQQLERWELGLDYLSLLYKRPQQILPILCLVSNERQTGKTTFAKWLNQLFTENMAIVGNEDLAAQFNAHWASKLIICCDETKIDKHVVMEKIKSLSTASSVMMNAKGKDQVNMEFFGKFILLSNNEDNFASIDREEIRFWVLKVPQLAGTRNVQLLDDLLDEIPAFLHYLHGRQIIAENKERHWFDTRLLRTEALEKVVANSRPGIEKQLQLALTELFEATGQNTITITLEGITNDLLRRKFDKDYVRRTLHNDGYRTHPTGRRKYPRFQEVHSQIPGGGVEITTMDIAFHNRYYEFKREHFVTEPALISEESTIPPPDPAEDLPF